MKVVIRPGQASDHALVFDSIVQSYRSSPHAQGASNAVLASLIEPLLSSPKWALSIACTPDDPDTILGFVLHGLEGRIPTIAWVQVRGVFRRHGVGRALVVHALGDQLPPEVHAAFMVTKIDDGGPHLVDLARAHGVNVRFRPYLPLQAALDNAAA